MARMVGPVVAALAVAGLAGACGGSDPSLPPQAAEGRDIVRQSGCASCHGRNGAGGVGPSWIGLYGGTEDLDDGRTVTVDEAYIRRSISDPAVDKVAGYNVIMPENNLTEAEITSVIAYIKALA